MESSHPGRARAVRHWAARNVGTICVALVLLYCVVGAFDPPRLNWGDPMSDYNVMTAGRNFARYGFLKLKLTPYLLDPQYMHADDRMLIYTHYPQLPDLTNGVLRVTLGLSTLVQFRFVALMLSFAALFFVYRLIERYWGRRTAQIGLALWVVNPLWVQHADYLHHGPYGAFFGFACLYFVARWLDEAPRPGQLAIAAVCAFLVILSSYDWWFFAPLLILLVGLASRRTVGNRRVIIAVSVLAASVIAAVLFKFATNAWALGGMHGLMADVRFQVAERGTSVEHNFYRSGIWPTAFGRVERFFTILLLPVTAFWIVVPFVRGRFRGRLDEAANGMRNPLWLMAAALPFFLAFASIWVGQYYPGLLVLPFYAVACASAIAILVAIEGRARLVAGVFFVALIANSVAEIATFKKAFLSPKTIATLGPELDSVSARGQVILVNHVFDAAYRYYFNRNTEPMIVYPAGVADIALSTFADPRQRPKSGTSNGAIFVQHKHLADELYDKGCFYLLAHYKLWPAWGNPPQYRPAIDTLIAERNATLVSKVSAMGTKLYETDDYAIWRVHPQAAASAMTAALPSR